MSNCCLFWLASLFNIMSSILMCVTILILRTSIPLYDDKTIYLSNNTSRIALKPRFGVWTSSTKGSSTHTPPPGTNFIHFSFNMLNGNCKQLWENVCITWSRDYSVSLSASTVLTPFRCIKWPQLMDVIIRNRSHLMVNVWQSTANSVPFGDTQVVCLASVWHSWLMCQINGPWTLWELLTF